MWITSNILKSTWLPTKMMMTRYLTENGSSQSKQENRQKKISVYWLTGLDCSKLRKARQSRKLMKRASVQERSSISAWGTPKHFPRSRCVTSPNVWKRRWKLLSTAIVKKSRPVELIWEKLRLKITAGLEPTLLSRSKLFISREVLTNVLKRKPRLKTWTWWYAKLNKKVSTSARWRWSRGRTERANLSKISFGMRPPSNLSMNNKCNGWNKRSSSSLWDWRTLNYLRIRQQANWKRP